VITKDKYGRSVAICYKNGSEDLNAWMAANGYAVAYIEYSEDYKSQADAARQEQLVRFILASVSFKIK
jgi:endonuclease YncB( thermonuclease family)